MSGFDFLYIILFIVSVCFFLLLAYMPVGILLACAYLVSSWRLKQKGQSEALQKFRARYKQCARVASLIYQIVIIAVYVFNAFVIDPRNYETATLEREKVVRAPDAYYNHNGHYPNTLPELVPIELDQVPAMPAGMSLQYLSYGQGFQLVQHTGFMNDCWYFSAQPEWVCSD